MQINYIPAVLNALYRLSLRDSILLLCLNESNTCNLKIFTKVTLRHVFNSSSVNPLSLSTSSCDFSIFFSSLLSFPSISLRLLTSKFRVFFFFPIVELVEISNSFHEQINFHKNKSIHKIKQQSKAKQERMASTPLKKAFDHFRRETPGEVWVLTGALAGVVNMICVKISNFSNSLD